MGLKIKIVTNKVTMEAELNETETAKKIHQALPIETTVNTWGEEIYFTIPLKTKLEKGTTVVNLGDLGYWPAGPAFCIFFGKTPVSTETEIKPASAVTVIGRLLGNPKEWKKVSDGETIKIVATD